MEENDRVIMTLEYKGKAYELGFLLTPGMDRSKVAQYSIALHRSAIQRLEEQGFFSLEGK
jgi:hypothetical protein